jgi:ATP synthase protein I
MVLGVSLMGTHTPEKLELTAADLAQINQRSRLELVQIVKAQALLGLVVAILAWLIADVDAGLSALAGAGTYFVPNMIFALRLYLATFRPGGSRPMLFLVGEMLKIGAAVGLLWLVAQVGGDRVQWLAVLVGLIAVLKGYVLVLVFGRARI